MAERPGLLKSSAVISAGVLLSRLTGLLRTIVLIDLLGNSPLGDAYNFANNVPNLVYELLAGGVLSAVLLPLFVDLLRSDDHDGTSALVSVAVGALGAITLAGVLAAPALAWAIAALGGGGGDQAAERAATTVLLRWFIPQVFFYGLITVVTALLQARRRFAAAAFAPALNNVVVIGTFLAVSRASSLDLTSAPLTAVLGEPRTLALLGAGTTLGVAVSAMGLVPSLARAGVALRPNFDRRDPAIARLAVAARGALGFVLVSQVGVTVTSSLAKRYRPSEGDFSAWNYANLLFFVVYGLLVVSITTALGPELAQSAQTGDEGGVRREWLRGLRLIVLLMAPASAGLGVMALPLMRILPFREDAAATTAVIFRLFCFGLLPFSVIQYVVRAYYALSERREPFRLAVVQNGVVVGLGLLVTPLFAINGLSVVYIVGYAVTAVLAFSRFAHRLGRLRYSEVTMLPRMVGAALAMATVVAAVQALLHWGDRSVAPLLTLVAGTVVGAATYPAFLWALRADDDLRALAAIARRLAQRPAR
ncbi:MAG: murein biosynthesis integral membrane protein MurJ [Acidimicrobiales bacterium]|nr:murein biosynthesis integral membrane protein MurJ [Acidimicrobiales bacterium]